MASLRSRIDGLSKRLEPLNSTCHIDYRQIFADKLNSHADRLRSQPGYIEPTTEETQEAMRLCQDYLTQRFNRGAK